jgi:hypothetical protein
VRLKRTSEGIELSAIPLLRRLLISRWPQWILTALALAGFLYAILAGLFGTPVGNRNFAITAVWIAWWAVLILILVPLGGRAWCSICPIPAAGDWLQRGGLMTADGRRPRGKGLRWPRRLRNLWPQNVGFLLLGITSTVILTTPLVSALVLVGLLGIALIVSAIFERRTFCRYLCPVGGFIGMYSLAAPLALRVKDPAVCAQHAEKECYRGSELGHGCPWIVYPGTLQRNAACGLCLECLRTCPLDNVALVLKSPGSDLTSSQPKPPLSLDESFKAFIMLGAALVYSAVLFGPWATWKQAAYGIGSLPWIGYALAFAGLVLLVIPALYAAAAWLGRRFGRIESIAWRNFFLRSTAGLVPLGLAAWIAFSLSFVFINGSYVVSTLSDPLGLNWDLFGTAEISWQPLLSGLLPGLQLTVLLIGLAWSTSVTIRAISHTASIRGSRLLASVPTIAANTAMVLTLGWLYL